MALKHYVPLLGCPGVDLRVQGTTLYNSIYRFDDVMLVNTHVWGVSAFGTPVLQLRRLVDGGLFDTYAHSFESVLRRLRASLWSARGQPVAHAAPRRVLR